MAFQKLEKDTLFLLGGIGAILTGLIGVLTYVNTKEHRRLQKANAQLEMELNLLDLEIKKSQIQKINGQR
jgi:ABC-type arginine transport system ATPase subunit